MRKVRLGFLVALVAVLAIAGSAWAGTSESSNDIDLAAFDIYRTGTPDYDLVWEFYTQFDIRVLEHLPRAGVPRPDGYYWVIVRQEERDVIDEMVEELQQIMGEDFPIAVSVSSPAPMDEAAMTTVITADDIEWGKADIYRTGTPDYDLVKEFYKGFDVRNLKHWSDLIAAAGARRDGYYWLLVREENWDAIHHTIFELQQLMGENFPIAFEVGEYRPGGTIPVEETAGKSFWDIDWSERDIYRTGSPDLKLVKEFYKEFDMEKHLTYAQGNPPLIVAAGVRLDGYYEVSMREENWDAIYETVRQLQAIMGEDFPIAVGVENIIPYGDVFGGHRCVIQRGVLNYNVQTLGFAALRGGEVGMVLSGHYKTLFGRIPMPLNALVYSPTSFYPLLTNLIGLTECVGGDYSDSSYMRPYYGGGRIKAGVQHYGSHMPAWSWEDPQIDDWVYKTGSETGTTVGQVYRIGSVWADHHGRYLENQFFATNYGELGDSGSPVYWIEVIQYPIPNGWWPPDPEFAIMTGVLWAGSIPPGQFIVFSTITQVMDDLDVWPLPGPFW